MAHPAPGTTIIIHIDIHLSPKVNLLQIHPQIVLIKRFGHPPPIHILPIRIKSNRHITVVESPFGVRSSLVLGLLRAEGVGLADGEGEGCNVERMGVWFFVSCEDKAGGCGREVAVREDWVSGLEVGGELEE